MNILIYITIFFVSMFLFNCIMNVFFIPNLSKYGKELEEAPFISIIVPARNEERGIEKAVTSFCNLDYPGFEVIVVNDRSTDNTGRILKRLSESFKNLNIIEGSEPPEGWMGKVNAMEEGLRYARGEYLLFVDADVIFRSDLLKSAVYEFQKRKLSSLVLLPKIEVKGMVEGIILTFLSSAAVTLPVFLANIKFIKFIAGGGGVFHFLKKKDLLSIGGLERIKDKVIDDVALGFLMKRYFPFYSEIAADFISVRMYHGAKEALNGFVKNSYSSLKNPFLLLFFIAIAFLINFYPIILLFTDKWTIGLLLITATILVESAGLFFFKMPFYLAVFYPVRQLVMSFVIVRSMILYYTKGVEWRGRTYKFSKKRLHSRL